MAFDSVVKFFFTGFAVARPLFVLLENLVKNLPFTTPTEALPFLFLVSAVLEEVLKYYVAASTAVPSPYPKGTAVPRTARRKTCAVYYIALACGYAASEDALLTLTGDPPLDRVTLVQCALPLHVLCGAIMSAIVAQECMGPEFSGVPQSENKVRRCVTGRARSEATMRQCHEQGRHGLLTPRGEQSDPRCQLHTV